jgi:hypothetical protein
LKPPAEQQSPDLTKGPGFFLAKKYTDTSSVSFSWNRKTMNGVNYSPYSGPEEFYSTLKEMRGEDFANGCRRRIEERVAAGLPVKIDIILREEIVALHK